MNTRCWVVRPGLPGTGSGWRFSAASLPAQLFITAPAVFWASKNPKGFFVDPRPTPATVERAPRKGGRLSFSRPRRESPLYRKSGLFEKTRGRTFPFFWAGFLKRSGDIVPSLYG